MFFALSKVFWLVAQPISLSMLLVAAGLMLTGRRRRVWGLWVGGAGLAILVVCACTNLGMVLIAPLEGRFERPGVLPAQVSTIIMLGGATDGPVSSSRGISELTEAGDRVLETLRLAELFPTARVVLTGGSGRLGGDAESEASIASRLLQALGVSPERLVLEEASRNTDENALLTNRLVAGDNGAMVLVTSAYHMPRSVGLFRQAGLAVIPWPVDYRSTVAPGLALDIDSPLRNVVTISVALREWIGLLIYAATGRIATVLPGPELTGSE